MKMNVSKLDIRNNDSTVRASSNFVKCIGLAAEILYSCPVVSLKTYLRKSVERGVYFKLQ